MHNNSMFNNSATLNNGNNFPNANHHAMLLSPNLHTLYDKKKEPPPPYPGRVQEQQQMDTTEDTEADEMSANNANLMNNSSASKTAASSVVRYCSPQAYKFYMEQHAENILKNHKAREFRRDQLENEMSKVDLPPSKFIFCFHEPHSKSISIEKNNFCKIQTKVLSINSLLTFRLTCCHFQNI